MKPTEKDLQTAREWIEKTSYHILNGADTKCIYIGGKEIILTEQIISALSYLCANYTLHLESIGKIKFTEGRAEE